MPAELGTWPDAELVALDLLDDLAPTVTATDHDLTGPAILVQRVGGADNGVTDRPVLLITCFAADRQAAWQLGRAVQQRVLAAGATVVSGQYVQQVLVDSARTVTPPDQVPDPNRDLRVVTAQYQLGLRRQYPPST